MARSPHAALLASLVAIVAPAALDSLVARLQTDEDGHALRRGSGTDCASLKATVATAIVTVSAIQPRQVSLKREIAPSPAGCGG